MKSRLYSAISLFALAPFIHAADVTTSIDFASSYVFHGNTYSTGPCLQPLIQVSGEDIPLIFTGWGNFELEGDHTRGVLTGVSPGDFSEIDLFLTYPLPIEWIESDITLGNYMYPNTDIDADTEVQFGIGKELLKAEDGFPVHAFMRFNHLIAGSVDGLTYLEGGLDGFGPIAGKWSWNYKLKIAWLDMPDGGPSGWSDLLATLGVEYAISDKLAATASVSYIGQLDDEIVIDDLYIRDVTALVGLRYSF